MIKMIDAIFNVEFWVADNRVEEYLKKGHKLAEPEKPKKKPVKIKKEG